uniref:Uncharacterized protein n=1 Tax=viral metagenome TaxID=1070528 RepID=A0A6M3M028_9ZZZZ
MMADLGPVIDISELEKNLEGIEMPDDLRKILERYIELYRVAQRCNDDILFGGRFVKVSSSFPLWFDSSGSLFGNNVSLEDIIGEWGSMSLHGAPVRWSACYECPNEEDMISKLEAFLKPLEDAGWCISATRKSKKKYEIYCLVSDEAMMTGVKRAGDEAFFTRFFGFKTRSEYD